MKRTLLCVGALILASISALAADDPGNLLSGQLLGDKGTAATGAPAANTSEKQYKLEFAGGTVTDLVTALTKTLGQLVVPRRAYDRALPEFTLPGKPPEDAFSRMSMDMGLFGPGMGGTAGADSKAETVSERGLMMMLARYTRVGTRPGWLIRPGKPAPEGEVNAPKLRELDKQRDLAVIPFIDFRNNPVTIPDLLTQVHKYTKFAIVVDDKATLPEGTFPIYKENTTPNEFMQQLAAELYGGAEAVPVQVAYDLTVDMQEYLECITEDELAQAGQMLDWWNKLSDEQKKSLLDTAWNQFKNNMSADQRGQLLSEMQNLMNSMGGMLASMGGDMMNRMQGMYGDIQGWYNGLGAGDRSELAGVMGAFGKMLGGATGGRTGGGRPGLGGR